MIIRAWHFTDGMKLRDGTPLEAGRLYTVTPPLVMCEKGLHASVRAIDALHYAPGSVVSLVECGGVVEQGDDKLVCSERRVVACADVARELRLWAADCAETALMVSEVEDARSWRALDVARDFANGLCTVQDLDAAWDAAGDAAWAARDAARAAAGAAAGGAAWAAAGGAAWAAAGGAERAWQTERLCELLELRAAQ